MDWTNLGTPRPRAEPLIYRPKVWADANERGLSRVDALPQVDTAQLLFARRSCRAFKRAADEKALGHLLYLSAYARSQEAGPSGFNLVRSCTPSAGSIHGVHILVIASKGQSALRYDTKRHSLVELADGSACAQVARAEASKLLELSDATVLLLAAEPGMYSAKYDFCESLYWRDAGVLLGYLSFIAHALELDFCPLGITGDDALRHLDEQSQLLGVGMAVVGARSLNPCSGAL